MKGRFDWQISGVSDKDKARRRQGCKIRREEEEWNVKAEIYCWVTLHFINTNLLNKNCAEVSFYDISHQFSPPKTLELFIFCWQTISWENNSTGPCWIGCFSCASLGKKHWHAVQLHVQAAFKYASKAEADGFQMSGWNHSWSSSLYLQLFETNHPPGWTDSNENDLTWSLMQSAPSTCLAQ